MCCKDTPRIHLHESITKNLYTVKLWRGPRCLKNCSQLPQLSALRGCGSRQPLSAVFSPPVEPLISWDWEVSFHRIRHFTRPSQTLVSISSSKMKYLFFNETGAALQGSIKIITIRGEVSSMVPEVSHNYYLYECWCWRHKHSHSFLVDRSEENFQTIGFISIKNYVI